MKASKKKMFGKMFLVVFLTCLIWVWADLSQDVELPNKTATVEVDKTANPRLWVHFNNLPGADIRVTLSGPRSVTGELDRTLRSGQERLRFDLDVVREKMDSAGSHKMVLLDFLQKNKETEDLRARGLKVVSCDPNMLSFEVVKLAMKKLTVRCIEEDGSVISGVVVDPDRVDTEVPESWAREKLVADVRLSAGDIQRAQQGVIERTPYIKLAQGVEKKLDKPVRIRITEDDPRQAYIVEAKLGIAMSPTMQGQYKVDVKIEDLRKLVSGVKVKATPPALEAYKNMTFQVILGIRDDDKNSDPSQWRRKLIYNFPEKFVRSNEIILNQREDEVSFELTPLASTESTN